ncbi:terminase small subunit [Cedecea sp. FDAARGOS_727]|uniref:terminase small subunit n=1 Tax=Cedecea sp. FDAARGOS_727 TaxID=2545798 RepID=UPI00143E5729|nr:terminase small subunit [Cedecea sp. FDAARGOS_727]QIX97446.1 terminase small subunit [Cedecea sp. FDAARGOS_727]
MAKPDWGALQDQFLAEHAKTGISPKDWCEAQGLNYASAKRYIKIANGAANSQKKTAKKTVNSQKGKTAKKTPVDNVRAMQPAKERKSSPPPSAPEHSDSFDLSDQQMLFAQYVVDGNTRADAYRQAGYVGEGGVAYAAASRLLRNVKVSRYIHHLRNERQKRYAVELDDVIAQLNAIINADPNEIAQYRRVNCRYCWGFGHNYQWQDMVEFEEKLQEATEKKKTEPRDNGGYGFDATLDPNPECPRCNGKGNGEAFFADTRDVEGDARYLLQGVKLGKFGIEISTADKDAARRELAKLLVARGSGTGKDNNDLARQLLELEIRKRAAEAERAEQEVELRRKGNSPDEEPTVVIKLVNSPDAD